MIRGIYSIYDKATEIYNTPYYAINNADARRSFAALCNDDASLICRYPDDYDLYYIGDFDDASGLTTSETPPRLVARAINCRQLYSDAQVDAYTQRQTSEA